MIQWCKVEVETAPVLICSAVMSSIHHLQVHVWRNICMETIPSKYHDLLVGLTVRVFSKFRNYNHLTKYQEKIQSDPLIKSWWLRGRSVGYPFIGSCRKKDQVVEVNEAVTWIRQKIKAISHLSNITEKLFRWQDFCIRLP